ncbi:hypothetical protein H9P43_007134 [Blastocladiella emersonii ATCC 22665]|nr:hypothetical protein H9P43_007134 [Blastocladiella emersonii ATCC 22665]
MGFKFWRSKKDKDAAKKSTAVLVQPAGTAITAAVAAASSYVVANDDPRHYRPHATMGSLGSGRQHRAAQQQSPSNGAPALGALFGPNGRGFNYSTSHVDDVLRQYTAPYVGNGSVVRPTPPSSRLGYSEDEASDDDEVDFHDAQPYHHQRGPSNDSSSPMSPPRGAGAVAAAAAPSSPSAASPMYHHLHHSQSLPSLRGVVTSPVVIPTPGNTATQMYQSPAPTPQSSAMSPPPGAASSPAGSGSPVITATLMRMANAAAAEAIASATTATASGYGAAAPPGSPALTYTSRHLARGSPSMVALPSPSMSPALGPVVGASPHMRPSFDGMGMHMPMAMNSSPALVAVASSPIQMPTPRIAAPMTVARASPLVSAADAQPAQAGGVQYIQIREVVPDQPRALPPAAGSPYQHPTQQQQYAPPQQQQYVPQQQVRPRPSIASMRSQSFPHASPSAAPVPASPARSATHPPPASPATSGPVTVAPPVSARLRTYLPMDLGLPITAPLSSPTAASLSPSKAARGVRGYSIADLVAEWDRLHAVLRTWAPRGCAPDVHAAATATAMAMLAGALTHPVKARAHAAMLQRAYPAWFAPPLSTHLVSVGLDAVLDEHPAALWAYLRPVLGAAVDRLAEDGIAAPEGPDAVHAWCTEYVAWCVRLKREFPHVGLFAAGAPESDPAFYVGVQAAGLGVGETLVPGLWDAVSGIVGFKARVFVS